MKQLLDEARALPAEQRAALADELIVSVWDEPASPEYEQAWAEELQRRWDEIESGKVQTVPVEEFFQRLEQRRGKPAV